MEGAIFTMYNTVLIFTGTNNLSNNSAIAVGAICTYDNTVLNFTGTNNFTTATLQLGMVVQFMHQTIVNPIFMHWN